MKLKGIIFDLDGVIVSTDHYHYLAWKAIADELGIPFSEEDNERLRGVSRMDSLNLMLEKADNMYSDKEKEILAERKNKIYQSYLHQLTPNDVTEEVYTTINVLKHLQYRLAIGSSSRNTMLILENLGLTSYFDAIIDGTMIQYSKPHPEVFMKAAEKLGLDVKQCLVVEDANAGCIAAKSASIKVAGISSANGNLFADFHLNRFDDLLSLVKEMNT